MDLNYSSMGLTCTNPLCFGFIRTGRLLNSSKLLRLASHYPLPIVPFSVYSTDSLELSTSRKIGNNLILYVIAMGEASSRHLEMSNLKALSPLDGHYWRKVKELTSSLSEFGFIYFRVLVEPFQDTKATEDLRKEIESYASGEVRNMFKILESEIFTKNIEH